MQGISVCWFWRSSRFCTAPHLAHSAPTSWTDAASGRSVFLQPLQDFLILKSQQKCDLFSHHITLTSPLLHLHFWLFSCFPLSHLRILDIISWFPNNPELSHYFKVSWMSTLILPTTLFPFCCVIWNSHRFQGLGHGYLCGAIILPTMPLD